MSPACVLSIEPSETLFSLATRYCRVRGITFDEMVSVAMRNDRAALRDFPILASGLEAHMHTTFKNRESLFTEHSACQYFATTLDEPIRSAEIQWVARKLSGLLHNSVGTAWAHLRFCRQCADREFELRRYSWWHRDHQLPLSSVCLLHDCQLENTSLANLGVWQPHELLYDAAKCGMTLNATQSFENVVTRFEHFLAEENRHDMVSELIQGIITTLTKYAGEEFEKQKWAFSKVRQVILQLKIKGVIEPFNDWERIRVSICEVLRGSGYCDPVVAVLLIIAFNFPYLIHLDFEEEI